MKTREDFINELAEITGANCESPILAELSFTRVESDRFSYVRDNALPGKVAAPTSGMLEDPFEGCVTFDEMDKHQLITLIERLFKSLDNIDTFSDMAKGNDEAFRSMTEREVMKRWKWLSSDGHEIRVRNPDITVEFK